MFMFAQTIHAHSGAALPGKQAGPFAQSREWDLSMSDLSRSVMKSKAKPGKVSRSPDSAFAMGLLLHLFLFGWQ